MKRFPFKKVKAFLNDFNSSFERVNWGGCAAVAHMLAKVLKPRVDELRIVAYDDWLHTANSVDDARKHVEVNTVYNWNKVGIAFAHVWVEFKWRDRWYAIDAEGLKSRRAMHRLWGKPFDGSFTLKEMKELSSTPSGWNPSFRRGQIPSMRKMVNSQLGSLLKAA